MSCLVNKTEPRPHISRFCWGWEFLYRVEESAEWLNLCVNDVETGEVYLFLCELKLLLVQDNTVLPKKFQEVEHPPPMFLKICVPHERIVYALRLASHVGNDFIETSCIAITAGKETLRGHSVSITSPRRDEACWKGGLT